MAKKILTVLLIVLLYVLVGCYEPDSGRSQYLPTPMKSVSAVEASEADIVEHITASRLAYRQYLESLIVYYRKAGDDMKLSWAEDELKRLNGMPQYNYIIEASMAGPDLKPEDTINEANYLYDEGYRLEKTARRMFLFVDENLLRMALDKYNQVIKQYPTSNKVDDAAYRAGVICERFRDYTIALLYFQRAYQWNPATSNPARYKAAFILDQYLARRAEALPLYQQSLESENLNDEQRKFGQQRINILTKGGGSLEENK